MPDDEPEVTGDPLEPSLHDSANFGPLPSSFQETGGETMQPNAEFETPAADEYSDYIQNVDPVQVGEEIPWDESLDTRIPGIVETQFGLDDDTETGPELPDNLN